MVYCKDFFLYIFILNFVRFYEVFNFGYVGVIRNLYYIWYFLCSGF